MLWMGPSQGLRQKWEIRGRACTWNPALPTLPLENATQKCVFDTNTTFMFAYGMNLQLRSKSQNNETCFKPKNVKPYSFYFSFQESQIGLPAIRGFMTNLCDAVRFIHIVYHVLCIMQIFPLGDETFFSYTICICGSNQRPADEGGYPSFYVCLLFFTLIFLKQNLSVHAFSYATDCYHAGNLLF